MLLLQKASNENDYLKPTFLSKPDIDCPRATCAPVLKVFIEKLMIGLRMAGAARAIRTAR